MSVVQESTSQTVMAEKPEEVSNGDLVLKQRLRLRASLSKMKKAKLQRELESHGAKTTGSKDFLIEKLIELRLASNADGQSTDEEADTDADNRECQDSDVQVDQGHSNSELTFLFNAMQ